MIIIFLGPPFAGKDTQSKLISIKYNLPVFSMGAIIRDAYARKDPKAVEGFENYTVKGLTLPIGLKFDLLKNEIRDKNNFILDNFPVNQEDLDTFLSYLKERGLKVDYVFHLNIDENEIFKRITRRERRDDDPDIVRTRIEIQGEQRQVVLKYFKQKGILLEIDGKGEVNDVFNRIVDSIKT